MNGVNKTLYIPLYGKSYVSKRGIILEDKTAEDIWEREGFTLKGKSASKWLAYYMGMRARVFDDWTADMINNHPEAVVLHLGCGLDSRVNRVNKNCRWFDIDFPEVIDERCKYFSGSDNYTMLSADLSKKGALDGVSGSSAIVVMEGISMYLTLDELKQLFAELNARFDRIFLLMDCYSVFAAKMSKIKNPINDVGVTRVYGLDDPALLGASGINYVCEHKITPEHLINQLSGMEKAIFRKLYAGKTSEKLYKLYRFEK